MKSVLISIQSYYVFLIIARLMGWSIPLHKEVEVRKDFPQDKEWNRTVYIYCSKNRKSFNRIPAQYQPFMAKLLGKVIGEFVCDRLDKFTPCAVRLVGLDYNICVSDFFATCLTEKELNEYGNGKTLYGLHITDLKIYDKPKELGEFRKPTPSKCSLQKYTTDNTKPCAICGSCTIKRPFQSWGYVEEV